MVILCTSPSANMTNKSTTIPGLRLARPAFGHRRHAKAAFTLIEVMITGAIVSISMLATLSMLMYCRLENSLEQERARAHQIICEEIEKAQSRLYTVTTSSQETTVWDNGTPNDPTDDTKGTLDVIAKDPNGTEMFMPLPVPAPLLAIEVTLTWKPRGPLSGKTMRETAMTYKAP